MIEGGKGGAKTNVHGLEFERRVDLRNAFDKLNGYEIKENDLYFEEKMVGKFYKKHGLYSGLLKEHKIDASKRISKKLLPDETLLILKTNTLFIIEMKFQKTPGSVDEKLQTCDFKLKQYEKILKGSGIKVKYLYVLNNWFKKKEYKDTLDYIKSVDCDYYFNELKFSVLGLPSPGN